MQSMGGMEHMAGQLAAWLLSLGARVGGGDWRLLLAGVGLHVLGQLARARGWLGILRYTAPEAGSLALAPVLGSWMAGTGAGGLLPARLGDAVKLWLVRRHLPGAPYLTLAGTLVAEGAFYAAISGLIMIWALASGVAHFDVSFSLPVVLAVAIVITLGVGLALTAGRKRARRVAGRLRKGFAAMQSPRVYIRRVAGWQLLSRMLEIGSLACLLAAFGLPATILAALLALTAQGGGRVLPLLPLSAAVSTAWLSYALSGLGEGHVGMGRVAAFTVGATAIETVVGLSVAVTVLARAGLPLNPARLIRVVREGRMALARADVAPSAP